MLDVAVGKFLDTSLIKADVQPQVARLLIKGRLLQLVLPVEVSMWPQIADPEQVGNIHELTAASAVS